jgi:CubicO group peptidase (beta-lactamase class C family)
MNEPRQSKTTSRSLRRALATVAVAVLSLLTASVRGDDLVLERLGDFLNTLREGAKIPGMAAAIVGPNDILWERGFGRQDIDRALPMRTDTPLHVDGISQVLTAAMTLRCVEEGGLSLGTPAGQFRPSSPDRDATLGNLLTHTSDTPSGLVFAYRPERLEPLWPAVRVCRNGSFRKTMAALFEQLAMFDSIPGQDINQLVPPAEGIPSPDQVARYTRTLARLATPYAIDAQGRASQTQYTSTTLTPGTGVISTVRDLARFDVALKRGEIVRLSTLSEAWMTPVGANRQRLPHGHGWFVQTYNNVPVVWQFGVGDNGSSSLMVMLPAQKTTMILLANSSGLGKTQPKPLSSGDVTVSLFAQVFLDVFAR